MKKILILSLLGSILISCGSSRPAHTHHKKSTPSKHHSRIGIAPPSHKNKKPDPKNTSKDILESNLEPSSYKIKKEIIDYAKTFEGTRYKFGGTTKAGMDCSGLVSIAFQKENIDLPRISRDMAKRGFPVSLNEIEEGDLVFFKTTNKNVISHVGLVVHADQGDIRFIHSTTRAGVIISSLHETYWKKAFVEVRRII